MTPTKVLEDYDDKEMCGRYLEQTKHTPLVYKGIHVQNMTDFVDQFSDLSQGEGEHGEDLYRRCDGDCSPSYKITITADNPGLTAESIVVCGHARDKDENKHILVTQLLWNCLEK